MSLDGPAEDMHPNWANRIVAYHDRGVSLAPSVIEALLGFEAELGAGWPGWRDRYPLAAHFFLAFGDRAPEGVRLHQAVRAVRDGPARRAVITRLGGAGWEGYSTARNELECAAEIAGLARFVEFIPEAQDGTRSPDFRALLLSRIVEFECTVVLQSEPERMAEAVFARLLAYPRKDQPLDRAVRVRFRKGANARVAFERLLELESAVVAASLRRDFVGVVGLADMEPRTDWEGLPSVEVHGGLTTGNGDKPLIQLERSIRGKLRRRQWTGSSPSVLVVRTDTLSFYANGSLPKWLHATAAMVLRCLAETGSEISAVMVHERWRGEPELSTLLDLSGHRAFIDRADDGWNRFVLLVDNSRAKMPLSRLEIDQVMSPQLAW